MCSATPHPGPLPAGERGSAAPPLAPHLLPSRLREGPGEGYAARPRMCSATPHPGPLPAGERGSRGAATRSSSSPLPLAGGAGGGLCRPAEDVLGDPSPRPSPRRGEGESRRRHSLLIFSPPACGRGRGRVMPPGRGCARRPLTPAGRGDAFAGPFPLSPLPPDRDRDRGPPAPAVLFPPIVTPDGDSSGTNPGMT